MEKESDKKTQNTAYIPTKCRVTKPVPPKPATNPMQFVAVKQNPLLIKAQEHVKKVEVIKEARRERKDDAEDWQSNLDNWKSSRRKRQEHIIERVEEVKKLELEGKERGRRRGTTFSEILEKRNKGRFSIPIYDNDSNDLSDYGIGSSSSKTNSIKDVDTDDNSSILDEKENSYYEASTAIVCSAAPTKANASDGDEAVNGEQPEAANGSSVSVNKSTTYEQYTYEGAIEDYRSRIRNKINFNEAAAEHFDATFSSKSKEYAEAQTLLPKGNLFERKKMFESSGVLESCAHKHLPDEFTNAQSIKERLQSLERCSETQQPLASSVVVGATAKIDDALVGSLKTRLDHFNQSEAKNTNAGDVETMKKDNGLLETTPNCLDIYLDKMPTELNGFRPSASSSDLVGASSDREDSGIHTADVSCSVSQSDEPVEDADVLGPNVRSVTELFLHGEKEFADKIGASQPMIDDDGLDDLKLHHHSSLVENINKTIEDEASSVDEPKVAEVDKKVFDFYANERTPFTLDSINDIFEKPLQPKMMPPSVKPPPPPTVAEDQQHAESGDGIDESARIKKEMLMKRYSFLGLEETVISDKLEQMELLDKQKEQDRETAQTLKPLRNVDSDCNEASDEEDLMKKEREIIALVEKEEKCKDHDTDASKTETLEVNIKHNNNNVEANDIYLGNKKFDEPFYPEPCYNDLDDQDSEVLKVEQELLQLEKEELKRQRENLLFQERSAKLHAPITSYDNLFYTNYAKNTEIRKSMPDLKNLPNVNVSNNQSAHATASQAQHTALHHQKSTPNIQHASSQHYQVQRNNAGQWNYYLQPQYNLGIPIAHRKSLPDLEQSIKSAFTPTTAANNSLLMPIQPLKPIDKKDRYMYPHPIESDAYSGRMNYMPHCPNNLNHQANVQSVNMPRSKSIPREMRIQPKQHPQAKSYNQHWLCQEAELRRLAEQQKANALTNRQNQLIPSSPKRNIELMSSQDYVNVPYNPQQTYGRALPMSSYPSQSQDSQDVILSVSGKKKCSYCNNELGRGAAMIIESLQLFYHMECFKCCVCHTELGDGLMGIDVRVRNEKLHCHNCYSSDDGIKFSCV